MVTHGLCGEEGDGGVKGVGEAGPRGDLDSTALAHTGQLPVTS